MFDFIQEEDVNKVLDSIVQFEDQLGDSSGEDETFLVTDPEAYRSRKSSTIDIHIDFLKKMLQGYSF